MPPDDPIDPFPIAAGRRPESQPQSSTDIAALSAGVVAVVVSLFVSPGIFGVVNLVVSITLFAVVLGYVWPYRRLRLQSLAVAAAVGLALIPAIGFLDETLRSRMPLIHLLGDYDYWNCDLDKCSESKERQSRVPDRDLTIGWFAVLIGVYCWDRLYQGKLRKNSTR